MGSTACYNCLRFLVVTVSLLVMIAALCMVTGITWVVVNTHAGQGSYTYMMVMLVGGGTVLLIATLGCCGVLTEARWMVAIFCISLMAMLVGQVMLVVMLAFQLSCCGSSGPNDWLESSFSGGQSLVKEIGIGSSNEVHSVKLPPSCCRNSTSIMCTSSMDLSEIESLDPAVFFIQGCAGKIVQVFEQHFRYLVCAGLGVLLLESLGLVFSLCLCCMDKKISDRKV